jgi:hypothetical protein
MTKDNIQNICIKTLLGDNIMKKQLHNYRSLRTLSALLALTINFATAQTPIPASTLPEQPVVAGAVGQLPAPVRAMTTSPIEQTGPVATEAVPAPKPAQSAEEICKADIAWLNYISSVALVPPLPGHAGIAAKIDKPDFENVIQYTLMMFKMRTLDDFSNNNIKINNPDTDEIPHGCKLLVNPGDEIYFVGDTHGCIGALARLMWIWRNMGLFDENFKIPNGKYLVLLGDYTDYGKEGIAVIYTLINLKLNNWNNVILLRGNHESTAMSFNGGFLNELCANYGSGKGKEILMANDKVSFNKGFFNILPTVLYIGLDNQHSFIQCCHGGIEPGFNPKAFLESDATFCDLSPVFKNYQFDDTIMSIIEPDPVKCDTLKASLYQRMENTQFHGLISSAADPKNPSKKHYHYANASISGFQWSDVMPGVPFGFNEVRKWGFVANKELMTRVGQACKICAYVRGHQHNLGAKIGDIAENANAVKAHWLNIFGLKPQPQLVEFPFSTSPLRFNVAIPSMYQALTNIKQLLAQSTVNLEEYNNAWQTFKKALPNFKFSAFSHCEPSTNRHLPIITLSSASEAAAEKAGGSGIYNPWDSFGLCTINATIEHSDFAIYEAEASAPQQNLTTSTKRKMPEQQISSPQNPTAPAKKKEIDEKKDPVQ